MQEISPLQERTQAGPVLCSTPCPHLYSPAPEPKFRAAASGCSRRSQVKTAASLLCLTQSMLQCHAAGKAAEEVVCCRKAARSFCQVASGERASQSHLSLDTLLICTPLLRLRMCMPFLVPLPVCWEGTARHPYLVSSTCL